MRFSNIPRSSGQESGHWFQLSTMPGLAKPLFRLNWMFNLFLGPFVQYRGIQGTKGKILGLWSVMMQVVHPMHSVAPAYIYSIELLSNRRYSHMLVQRYVYVVPVAPKYYSYRENAYTRFLASQALRYFCHLWTTRFHVNGIYSLGGKSPNSMPPDFYSWKVYILIPWA